MTNQDYDQMKLAEGKQLLLRTACMLQNSANKIGTLVAKYDGEESEILTEGALVIQSVLANNHMFDFVRIATEISKIKA